MFFLIGFWCHVTASFAFVLAILSANWATYQVPTSSSGVVPVQKGIFYQCKSLPDVNPYALTQCLAILSSDSSISSAEILNYQLSIASASIAIGCAGLSIIILWLLGVYFNRRTRDRCTQCCLILILLLVLVDFGASLAVWILVISEIRAFGQSADSSVIRWPMWLAVGASGGYLMAFIAMLISLCRGLTCRRGRSKKYSTGNNNQF